MCVRSRVEQRDVGRRFNDPLNELPLMRTRLGTADVLTGRTRPGLERIPSMTRYQ